MYDASGFYTYVQGIKASSRPNVIMRILTNSAKAQFVIVRKCTF